MASEDHEQEYTGRSAQREGIEAAQLLKAPVGLRWALG